MVRTLPAQSTIKKFVVTRTVSITRSLAIRALLTKVLSRFKKTYMTISLFSPMLERKYKTTHQILKENQLIPLILIKKIKLILIKILTLIPSQKYLVKIF